MPPWEGDPVAEASSGGKGRGRGRCHLSQGICASPDPQSMQTHPGDSGPVGPQLSRVLTPRNGAAWTPLESQHLSFSPVHVSFALRLRCGCHTLAPAACQTPVLGALPAESRAPSRYGLPAGAWLGHRL